MRALALVLLLALPAAAGQATTAPGATFLLYHAHPDPRAAEPDADPLSDARAPGPPGLAALLPTTRLDGAMEADPAPEGQPESVPARFREVQRLLLARQRVGAPYELRVEAAIEGAELAVRAQATPRGAPEGDVRLIATVEEDRVPAEGASGVRLHRHVARLDLPPQNGTQAEWRAPLDPAWDPARLGVVVSVRDASGQSLQSARWRAGQDGPTVQVGKAVLVEHATATWCVPCGPADEALGLLASRFGDGVQGDGSAAYLRPAGALAAAGALAGALAALWAARRRDAR